MKALVVHVVVSALLLVLVDHLLAGFAIAGFGYALIAALVLGVVNTFVRPVLILGLGTALLAALMLALFNLVASRLLSSKHGGGPR
jgi:putative membrane protein